MPGSPYMTPTSPAPAALRSHISASIALSAVRPIIGGKGDARALSNLLSLPRNGVHAPSLDRLFHALQLSSAERLTAERSANQLVSARADYDAILTGDLLKAGRDVCRTAEHFSPVSGLAGYTADDDHSGIHPDPHTETDEAAIRSRELLFSDNGGDRERGAHRAFGIVFVRLRHAEICQQSVANHSGDVATVLGNLLVADIAIGSDNCEEFLGIDLLTQRRRSDDVDKHHGKLSAFGVQNRDLGIRQQPCSLRCARLARFRSPAHDATMLSFCRTCSEARYTTSRIRLMLPSGLCCSKQFHGLNVMCSHSYS
jgi:hypothetical protein